MGVGAKTLASVASQIQARAASPWAAECAGELQVWYLAPVAAEYVGRGLLLRHTQRS